MTPLKRSHVKNNLLPPSIKSKIGRLSNQSFSSVNFSCCYRSWIIIVRITLASQPSSLCIFVVTKFSFGYICCISSIIFQISSGSLNYLAFGFQEIFLQINEIVSVTINLKFKLPPYFWQKLPSNVTRSAGFLNISKELVVASVVNILPIIFNFGK